MRGLSSGVAKDVGTRAEFRGGTLFRSENKVSEDQKNRKVFAAKPVGFGPNEDRDQTK